MDNFKILVTDLDGTLFYPKKKFRLISKKSIKFLQRFIDEGNKVLIASGRNFEFGKKVSKKLNRNIDFLGCNSALLYENNKIVYENCFDNEGLINYLNKIFDKFDPATIAIMSNNHNLVVYPRKYYKLTRFLYPLWTIYQGVYKEPYQVINKEKFNNILKSDKIYKVMIFFGLDKKAAMKASIVSGYLRTYDKYCEASNSSISIELTPLNVNKGEGVDIYVKKHKYDKNNVYVVGDSGNDVPMFKKYYENSFCMKHSDVGVQKNAKYSIKLFSDLENYL